MQRWIVDIPKCQHRLCQNKNSFCAKERLVLVVLEIAFENACGVMGLGRTDGNCELREESSTGSWSEMMATGNAACRAMDFGGVIIIGRLFNGLIGNVSGEGVEGMFKTAWSFLTMNEESSFSSLK